MVETQRIEDKKYVQFIDYVDVLITCQDLKEQNNRLNAENELLKIKLEGLNNIMLILSRCCCD